MTTEQLQISQKTLSYWAKEDFEELHSALSFQDMLPVAFRILRKMPHAKIHQVCGPIGSGGHIPLLGEKEGVIANLNSFNRAIRYLQDQGYNVFDQMPFEEPIQKLKVEGQYPHEVLTDFYWPIFESGFLHELHFMKNYATSRGAQAELLKAQEINNTSGGCVYLKISYFDQEF